ncbi:MAG: AraC family transcriptional regulator ligand-binding domain-containing protein [Nevskia sp.]|nr:AraC family transcriptional regulator ligand-binding domain-containing protein [Nevskia sp.]
MQRTQAEEGRAKAAARKKAAPRNSLPVAYLRLVLDITAERGVDAEQVLKGTRLTAAHLTAPDSRIASADAARAIANAIRLTGDRGIGLAMGLRTKPTAHGYLGYAVMSCNSLRESLEVAIRFIQLRQRDVSLTLSVEDMTAVMEASETHSLGPHRQLFLEGLMLGIVRVGGFVVGEPLLDCELWFDWPEPDYFAAYRAQLPPVRFSAPSVQIRFDAGLLKRQPVMADQGAARQAVEQCEREQALGGRGPDDIVRRVRAALVLSPEGYPDLAEVSARLFTSSRTLKRRLQQCGTSFQQLRDEARQRDAVRLLENPDLEVQQIAATLGYSDPPSFTRAFLRWTGKLPSRVRGR